MIDRRAAVLMAGGLVLPTLGVTQPRTTPRVIGGITLTKTASEVNREGGVLWDAALRRLGWEADRNLTVAWRRAEGDTLRLDGLARELVRLDVELIVAILNPAVASALRATRRTPIVMVGAVYPVELGFIQSYGRPGGNITGTAIENPELLAKSLQILRELAPDRRRIAVLRGPIAPELEPIAERLRSEQTRQVESLGMSVHYVPVMREDAIDGALKEVVARNADILLVQNSGVTEPHWRAIADFAIRHKILSIGQATLFTSVGGAMYYGSNLQDIIDRSANFVDRILRGAKPSELPVELPTKFDLILNLKSLQAIGIAPPRAVLLQASELIQ
jgi:putative ABC transport system substrate-binding protein